MAVAPTKMNDRFEWFLEKATEIGVEEITPLICENSERKQVKLARMEKIIESALKQSQQFHRPKLNPEQKFVDFLRTEIDGRGFIAHCHSSEKIALKDSLGPDQELTILIGPEGDFSVKEIEMALEHGFIPVNLSHNRLRTETAAVVACHTVALHHD